MNSVGIVLVLLSLGASCCLGFEQAGNVAELNNRAISATLYLNNAYDAGDWAGVTLCPSDSYAHAFEILFMPPGSTDETAINGVKLYCSTEEHLDNGYVTSGEGPEGDWYGMRVCTDDFLTGFRGKVLEYQGLFTDDVAVQDFEAECQYGSEILGGIYDTQSRFNDGTWSVWTQCPQGSAVCGLQTRVEPPQLLDDDTAVTDINLFCCPRLTSTVVN